ncbi:MAG: glycosyltransferase family 2 protein [Methanospirillaceae archaeon]|nr:glycosyltransferase family 2 protein [Methanospirillaceae archaeon]
MGKAMDISGTTQTDKRPLVSVGIPTYNRPEGLRRTLNCITGQTYKNLEIIVSDNCSLGPETERVVREFMGRDSRIQFFQQNENMGVAFNFQFVLEKATGEYFMWAADDDEWLPEFIMTNINNIGGAGSCMTNYITRNRILNFDRYNKKPCLTGNDRYNDLKSFLFNLYPGMVYGLHRRVTIKWVEKSSFFDFWDCFFSFRQILDNSFIVLPKYLFISGIDNCEYIYKPYTQKKKECLNIPLFLGIV